MKNLFLLITLFLSVSALAQAPARGRAGVPPAPQAAANPQAGKAQPPRPQGAEIALTEQNVPKEAVFAQPVEISFSFSHTPGYRVEIDKNTLPKDFEFSALSGTAGSPGTFTYTLTAFPFALKEAALTPVTFLLNNAEGQTAARVQTDEAKITVTKAKTFQDNNLREIRDPQAPYAWFKWVWLALALAALFAGWRYWKNKQPKALRLEDAPDNRPCDEIALSKLDALVQSGLWERREYKIFYLTLTDILREYLLRRFQIDTSADTSAEMLRRVKARGQEQLTPLLPKLRVFLTSSDLVKFARAVPPEELRNRDVNVVREVVDSTAERGQELAPAANKEAR